MLKSWRDHGEDGLAYVTLTDTPAGRMNFDGLYAAWKGLARRLRGRRQMGDAFVAYATSAEYQPERGALHLHGLVRGVPEGMAPLLDDANLSELASASGFGTNVHVELVRPSPETGSSAFFPDLEFPVDAVRVARYLIDDVATTVGRDVGRVYARPLRSSHNWTTEGREASTRAVLEARRPRADWA